jgi:hypothetical protein
MKCCEYNSSMLKESASLFVLFEVSFPGCVHIGQYFVGRFWCMKPETLFTMLHFLCNLWMGQISYSATFHWTAIAFQGQTQQLVEPICKLQRKWIGVNTSPVCWRTAPHYLFCLISVSWILCIQAITVKVGSNVWSHGPYLRCFIFFITYE